MGVGWSRRGRGWGEVGGDGVCVLVLENECGVVLCL